MSVGRHWLTLAFVAVFLTTSSLAAFTRSQLTIYYPVTSSPSQIDIAFSLDESLTTGDAVVLVLPYFDIPSVMPSVTCGSTTFIPAGVSL